MAPAASAQIAPQGLVPPTLQSVLASVASVASPRMAPEAYSSGATDADDAGSDDEQGGEEWEMEIE